MKNKLLGALALGALFLPGTLASAEELQGGLRGKAQDDGPTFSGNVAITSDYVFRGISQSDESIALQGGFDYGNGIFYAGVWGSSVSFNPNTNLELDFYAGVRPKALGIDWDFGVIGYVYPEDSSPRDLNYVEAMAAGSATLPGTSATISGKLFVSPDFQAESGTGVYAEIGASAPLAKYLDVSGSVGHQTIDDNQFFGVKDYTTWNVGATLKGYGFNLDLRYIDTSGAEAFGTNQTIEPADARGVVTLKRSF